MKKSVFSVIALLFVLSIAAAPQEISGDYVETRSADVYTGYCFANGEVGLVGDEAILGWHVRQGSWQGVPLADLSVVAAVKAHATLGDPYEDPYPATAVLIVDSQATPEQRAALLAFARHMGGRLFDHVERVVSASIEFAVLRGSGHHSAALVRAGNFVIVQTRSLNDQDHVCGNEETYYPPLTQVAHVMPAVAVTDQYQGPGLHETWSNHGKRSAFVGSFLR